MGLEEALLELSVHILLTMFLGLLRLRRARPDEASHGAPRNNRLSTNICLFIINLTP